MNPQQFKEAADRLLIVLDLPALVAPFGELELVGSAALGLMVWPDIDLQVRNGRSIELFRHLFDRYVTVVRKIWVERFEGEYQPALPRGHYLGIKTLFEEQEWKIDLWILSEEDQQRSDVWMHQMRSKLDDGLRDLIVRAKRRVMVGGRVPKGMSRCICQLVVEEGMRDEEELVRRVQG